MSRKKFGPEKVDTDDDDLERSIADQLYLTSHSSMQASDQYDNNQSADLLSGTMFGPKEVPTDVDNLERSIPDQLLLKSHSTIQVSEQYDEKHMVLYKYLLTLDMSLVADMFKSWVQKNYLKYFVRDDVLYRKGKKNGVPRRVICGEDEKKRILKKCHNDSGHRGIYGTFNKITDRYYWDHLYVEVRDYCNIRAMSVKSDLENDYKNP